MDRLLGFWASHTYQGPGMMPGWAQPILIVAIFAGLGVWLWFTIRAGRPTNGGK